MRVTLIRASLVLSVLIAGCQAAPTATSPGSTPTPAPAASTATATPRPSPAAWRTLTDDEGNVLSLAEEPMRVVSLTPATTELLFALGKGNKLVGRTDFDDYPPEAVELPAVASFTGVLIEQLVDLEPDLVIAGGNNFTPAGDITRLRELGLPVLVVYAADLQGVLNDIELVGRAVGAEQQAQEIVGDINARIEQVGRALQDRQAPSVFYEIGFEPEIYGPAPQSFVADMVRLAGGDPITTSDPVVFSISLEQLVTSDPEVIVLGDAAYGVCPESVAQREGWDSIRAVAEGNVRPVNDIIVTRPRPRIGEGIAALALAIHPDADIAPPADAGAELCSTE
ncbi:ABC transporter substrate-binding protein [soil metagenome]